MIDLVTGRVLSADGVELALVQAGDPGKPTLVFVHGYPDTKDIWNAMLERLAPDLHVVAYDVRGAGGSSAPSGPAAYDFERLADDLLAVIEAVSPQRPVHLIGHDWGGIAGWELAAMPRVHRRLASFTTIAGPSLRVVSEGLRGQLRAGQLLSLMDTVRRSWYVLGLCTPGVPTLAWRGVLGHGWWRRFMQDVEQIPAERGTPQPTLVADGLHGANLYRRNILWRVGSRGAGQQVPVPVQLIVPSADRFISSRYYDGAERYAPRLRRRTVPGSHWAPRTQPDLLAAWVREFVDDTEQQTQTAEGAGA